MASITGILILTPFFSPNVGGVETHLDNLVFQLNQHKIKSFVLTYSPLTSNISYKKNQTIGHSTIIRFPWPGFQLFSRLEKNPFFVFLYLTPYLLIRSFFWLLFNHSKISIIHSQGFNAAFTGNILAKCFHKKHLCSTHAVYDHLNGLSRFFTILTLSYVDKILCLSRSSQDQLIDWGINPQKISLYHYWINLNSFFPCQKIPKKFTVLFVGRLIAKKGVKKILTAATKLPLIKFIIVGGGPLEKYVQLFSQRHKNIQYLGEIPNNQLSNIYHQASVFCIASQYSEGFGRVNMEAVASGIPVVGSNFGAIPEALDSSVSLLFKPTTTNLIKNIKKLSRNPKLLNRLKNNCRPYALKNFSAKNFQIILGQYKTI